MVRHKQGADRTQFRLFRDEFLVISIHTIAEFIRALFRLCMKFDAPVKQVAQIAGLLIAGRDGAVTSESISKGGQHEIADAGQACSALIARDVLQAIAAAEISDLFLLRY